MTATARRSIGQRIEVQFVIAVLEEGLLAPVATLGNVVRNSGKDDAGESGDRFRLAKGAPG